MDQARPQRVVVMTGATGGFGVETLRRLAAEPDTRIIVGARGTERRVPEGVEVVHLDLASLTSVRMFCEVIRRRLRDTPIDLMILNAGLHGSRAEERSAEGYGLTFAVNHLAHYLLARLLLPNLADHGRLVITSSNMHDPPMRALKPKGLELQEWSNPTKGGSGTGVRSYIASKLCNLMTALSFSRLEDVQTRQIEVVAFNPGFTGGSSGRDASLAGRIAVAIMANTVFRILALFRPVFRMNSPQHAGRLLAQVALGVIKPPPGRVFVSLVGGKPTFPDPSQLASNRDAQDVLWRQSARMVGLD